MQMLRAKNDSPSMCDVGYFGKENGGGGLVHSVRFRCTGVMQVINAI